MSFLYIDMTQVVEIFPQIRQDSLILHSQYHGDARSQDISSYDTDLVKQR